MAELAMGRSLGEEVCDHERTVHGVAGLLTDDHLAGGQSGPRSGQYAIRVRGHLGEMMRLAFPALQAQPQGEDTVLTGPLPDQAALFGVLAEIEELGLELLEVRRLPPY
jgi:hypothetical protein